MSIDITRIISQYQERVEQRAKRLEDFYMETNDGFLVIQHPSGNIWGACNSVEDICRNNIEYLQSWLQLEHTDDIPYMEPWIGTGVYANAFGCDYVWRDNDAPHVHYRFHKIEETRGIEMPRWQDSPVMNMILETIDCLKERTRGQIPISLTDTQSAFDTATLILDAAEFFSACCMEPDLVSAYMKAINELIVDFSRVQMERIGEGLVARPGHIMPSHTTLPGLSISDDNLAVSSPMINQMMSLPLDQILADEFDGLAIHSCGIWSHTMGMLKDCRNIRMIDCAVSLEVDPTPNTPEDVRDALAGTGIIAKVRVGGNMEEIMDILDRVVAPGMRLVVEINYDPECAGENYQRVTDRIAERLEVPAEAAIAC